ncbi:MAG: hypothetical protein ABSF68_02945 [Candidatus Acidiferrales bacterium]|jgi:hypothetical protein
MKAVVGVFKSRPDAERGAAELTPLDIPKNRVTVLTPHATAKELGAVPTVAGEEPGMGKAMGAALGGAIGVAGGVGLVPMLASFLIPGVGQVLAIGVVGGVLLGALGAVGGGAAGGAIESNVFEGLPEDEMFVYEDALRKGRSVVVVMADNNEADAVRGVLENAGAESIDQARDNWWAGLRDAEKEKYETSGGKFQDDERYFRCGFEAALHAKNRDRTYEQCQKVLGDLHPRMHESEPFKRGFERGREYIKTIRKHVN